jgi:regulatory protein
VDGKAWRRVPDEVIVRCGLALGTRLERPLLRRLRTELLRAEALERSGRALAKRPLASHRLEQRLERARIPAATRRAAVETLESAGLLDDARLAESRAIALADRGWGDAAIAARLEADGFPEDLACAALEKLEPEAERAKRLVAARVDKRKAWALLARRGFSAESAESALGALDDHPGSAIG